MKNIKIRRFGVIIVLVAVLVSGLLFMIMNSGVFNTDPNFPVSELKISVDKYAPVIEFVPVSQSDDGYNEYYIFDDNPEYLNENYLADGKTPSSIAHFENLSNGVYTVFSYHHRGESVDYNAELYYDVVFSATKDSELEILNLGLDHNWDWNQAWADYTETKVSMPMFLRTFNCTCEKSCSCNQENLVCLNSNCPAIIRDEFREPKTKEFDNLNQIKSIKAGERIYLSDLVSYITEYDLNHFRYGGAVEPMWLMMKFKIKTGDITFDTIAYTNKEVADSKFSIWKKGEFDNEPQYKGIADNAPIVETEFNLEITDETKNGPIPVTVKNARVPDGYTIADGTFVTNVNTWREELPIAVESDIMELKYKDLSKSLLYGENSQDRDDIWKFDPYHTKIYSLNQFRKDKLMRYDILVGDEFEPNGEILSLKHPKNEQLSTDDFYATTACNLGNFGVTYKYIINLNNIGTRDRIFTYEMKSIAGQVYKFKQISYDDKVIKSDNGSYIMKNFDEDPKEDPNSKEVPKKRLDSALYSDKIEFNVKENSSCIVEIEVTTLTGCIAPMRNTFEIKE